MSGGGLRPPAVLVVGDATLDVAIALDEPVRRGGDAGARIDMSPGGQGANVAVRLARRGVAARLICALGDDEAGQLLVSSLAAEGVLCIRQPVGRTGMVAALINSEERTMLSDRAGIAADRLAAALDDAIVDASWLHVSGYPLRQRDAAGVARALRYAADAAASRVSVAGGSPHPGDPGVAAFSEAISILRPDLLVLGIDEASAVSGVQAAGPGAGSGRPAALAAALADRATVVVITAGPGGAAVLHEGTVSHVAPAASTGRGDAIGAGDAFVAVLIARLLDEAWPPPRPTLEAALGAAALAGAEAAAVRGAQGRTKSERHRTTMAVPR